MDIRIEDLTDDQLKQASDEMQRREHRAQLLDCWTYSHTTSCERNS